MARKTSGGRGELSSKRREELLRILQGRFEKHPGRHQGIAWPKVEAKLNLESEKLRTLHQMEKTGGEPDVVGQGPATGEYLFCDCSPQSPEGRRNICYDGEGQQQRERKGIFPAGNALEMAAAMGAEILTDEQYRELQKLGEFDTKTSSWIATPAEIRKLGGALFADRRFDTVFVYHNTSPTFYGSRGFRARLRV